MREFSFLTEFLSPVVFLIELLALFEILVFLLDRLSQFRPIPVADLMRFQFVTINLLDHTIIQNLAIMETTRILVWV